MLTTIQDVVVEVFRVFLEKEDVGLKLSKVIYHFFYFPLLVEEAELEKRPDGLQKYFWIFV